VPSINYTKEFQKKIGENIEQARLKNKKTTKEMASLLKLSICGYRNIERGITEITLSRLFIISNYLSVDYTDLLKSIPLLPNQNRLENGSNLFKNEMIDFYKQRCKDYKEEVFFLKKQIQLLADNFNYIPKNDTSNNN